MISDLVTLPEPISFLKVSGTFAEVGNPGTPYLLQSTLTYDQGAGNGKNPA